MMDKDDKEIKDTQVLCTCGNPIPSERLEALPGTKTCVKCSNVKPVHGDSRYGHLVVGKSDEDKRQMKLRYE